MKALRGLIAIRRRTAFGKGPLKVAVSTGDDDVAMVEQAAINRGLVSHVRAIIKRP
jgi:hypothetical protein